VNQHRVKNKQDKISMVERDGMCLPQNGRGRNGNAIGKKGDARDGGPPKAAFRRRSLDPREIFPVKGGAWELDKGILGEKKFGARLKKMGISDLLTRVGGERRHRPEQSLLEKGKKVPKRGIEKASKLTRGPSEKKKDGGPSRSNGALCEIKKVEKNGSTFARGGGVKKSFMGSKLVKCRQGTFM